MHTVARRTCAIALVGVAVVTSGCLVLAVGAGAAAAYGVVKYTDNEAYRDFGVPIDEAWRAALAALKDAGYPVSVEASLDVSEGRIEIDDAKLVVTREPDHLTRVSVRIGTFSTDEHRRRAALILDDVTRRLD
jgi:hypothetical protein